MIVAAVVKPKHAEGEAVDEGDGEVPEATDTGSAEQGGEGDPDEQPVLAPEF